MECGSNSTACISLFNAFANARVRRSWLPEKITVRTATPYRRMRLRWEDDTLAEVEFTSKGSAKSAVSVRHLKLHDKSAADAMKAAWSEHFGRLARILS